jgi:NhaA family Na+:H+ antiporter
VNFLQRFLTLEAAGDIVSGLFLGKQLGVAGTSWLAFRLKLAVLPHGASWRQFYGVALLCGIGFAMSLFIGVLAGSLLSGLAGVIWIGLGRR